MNLSNIKNIDQLYFLNILSLCLIGGITVFSSTYWTHNRASTVFIYQIIIYCIGFLFFFAISLFDYKKLKSFFVITGLAFLTLFLLFWVLFKGIEVYGVKRWIDLGIFSIQPAELTKLSIILALAYAVEPVKRLNREFVVNIHEVLPETLADKIKRIVFSGQFWGLLLSFIFFISAFLLIMLQKSLGNAVLVLGVYCLTLFSTFRVNLKHLALLLFCIFWVLTGAGFVNLKSGEIFNFTKFNYYELSLFLTFLIVVWRVFKVHIGLIVILFFVIFFSYSLFSLIYSGLLQDYQKERVETFFGGENDELAKDWNRQQSLNSIGSSGFFGNGFMKGDVVNNGLLPLPNTDFAFASFVEQFGFVGGFILILLFANLLIKIITFAQGSRDIFGSVLCIGIAVMIFLNTSQHIGVNLGLLPITGIPLPLISSGGSSIVINFIGLGLVQSVKIAGDSSGEEAIKLIDENVPG